MKTIATVITLLVVLVAQAQNPLTQSYVNPELAKTAKELSQQYGQELAISGNQILQFQNKIEEYLMKEEKIRNSEHAPKKKLAMLKEIDMQETADMSDILTQPQFRKYKKIKATYQPLTPVVVGEVSTENEEEDKEDEDGY